MPLCSEVGLKVSDTGSMMTAVNCCEAGSLGRPGFTQYTALRSFGAFLNPLISPRKSECLGVPAQPAMSAIATLSAMNRMSMRFLLPEVR